MTGGCQAQSSVKLIRARQKKCKEGEQIETIKGRKRKRSDGELINDDELNREGYLRTCMCSQGCEAGVSEEDVEVEEGEEPLQVSTSYTSWWTHRKTTKNEQDRISYI